MAGPKSLNRKLLRESWRLRSQILSIALVVATGIMTVVTMRGSYESLVEAQQEYYQSTRFADVWVSLRRAPESLRERIADIPGVAVADTRVTLMATLDIPELEVPALARMVSIPAGGEGLLNNMLVIGGRQPDAGAPDEIIINENFATARQLQPGDSLRAIVNGRARDLDIVGVGIAPEHSYAVPPGSLLPEDDRYGVIWMARDALGPANNMEGAFNEAFVRLIPGANARAVMSEIDRLLSPYGGTGAYPRADQPSHMMLQGELDENRVLGTIIPGIFLAVAVFLLHMVLGRLITTQRGDIAVLKAFGYSDLEVGIHYLMFAMIAVMLGAIIGTLGGLALGDAYIGIYRQYFDLPDLQYRLSPALLLFAVSVSVAGAITGALASVRKAIRLPPAEAMRPEAPARFRPGWLERIGMTRWLSASARMILRNVERKPLQTALSALGVALSVAILVVGMFMLDGIRHMMDLQFREIQREDIAVSFIERQPDRVQHELQRLPGVTRVELYRTEPVRLHRGHRQKNSAIEGVPADSRLRRLISAAGREQHLLEDGILISRRLADELQVERGGTLAVEWLEGRRITRQLTVSGVLDDLLGLSVYMPMASLEGFTGEAGLVSGARLAVDRQAIDQVYDRLKLMPAVAGVTSPSSMLESFESELANTLYIAIGFLIGFASVIAVGVIYNGARIALSERGRELASLRVMGFHRHEVSILLLGEQAVITLLSIPLGWLIGYALAGLITEVMQTDTFRIPFVIAGNTFLWSALITMLAALASALAVRRRLHRVDLISVLKTRE